MYKRLPITSWLPSYNSEKAVADFIAGITVGLTVIPQALAYATLAGLNPQVCTYFVFKFAYRKCPTKLRQNRHAVAKRQVTLWQPTLC